GDRVAVRGNAGLQRHRHLVAAVRGRGGPGRTGTIRWRARRRRARRYPPPDRPRATGRAARGTGGLDGGNGGRVRAGSLGLDPRRGPGGRAALAAPGPGGGRRQRGRLAVPGADRGTEQAGRVAGRTGAGWADAGGHRLTWG